MDELRRGGMEIAYDVPAAEDHWGAGGEWLGHDASVRRHGPA